MPRHYLATHLQDMTAPFTDPAFSSDSPEEMFYAADLLIERGQVAEAHQLLLRLLDRFPLFGRAWNHLGFLYETSFKNPATAEQHYRKALELAPEYPATWLNFAVLLSQQERWEELESLLQRCHTIPGMNKAKVHHETAIMREAQGRLQEAIQEYRAAIAASFSEDDIKRYQKSVERCERKIALLGSEPL
jgi:Flp pilus assembly protein TadD